MGTKENEKHQAEEEKEQQQQKELDIIDDQLGSHDRKLASPSAAMDVVLDQEEEEEAAAAGKVGDGMIQILSDVSVKQPSESSDTDKQIDPSCAQEIGRQQSHVHDDPKNSAAVAVIIIPTDWSKKQQSGSEALENHESNVVFKAHLEAPGGSASLLPLPPPTTTSLLEAQKVPAGGGGGGGGGGGDESLKEVVSGTSREEDEHPPELTILSSPGSDTDNSLHPHNFLASHLSFLTPMKEVSVNNEGDEKAATGEEATASLRHVLSDPITGTFMDDAMVARCGHTYGSATLIAVLETGKCIHCGTSVPADSLVPNFALRAAVHAFKQEDHVCEFTSMKAAKRKREQPEQQTEGSDGKTLALDLHVAGEQASSLDGSRPRGVQFPFAVGDQVLIKGNKRTPERFVGKEAIITTQCLNGWYLVQTLDQGESVRLQYRSLQKLGEKDPQPDLEAGKSPDHVGSGEKPRKSCYPKEAVPSLLPTTEEHPEGCAKEASPTMTVVFPIMPVKGTRTELHKKARKGDLTRSIDTAAASSMPGVGASDTLSPDMQSDVKMANISKVREETEVVEVVEDDPYDMKPVWTAPPLSEKAEALIDKTNGGSNVDKLLDLPQVWEGLKEPQGLQKPKEGSEVGSGPIIVPNIEVGDTFTIRSKRSVLANRGPSMSLSMESDPYRKVYSSGSRRRGSVGEAVVQEQLAPISVARKPLTKCPTQVGEKAGLKWVGPTGEKQIHKTVSIPNMNDILAIMQKDILGLEKQIPWNCLVKSWKMRRANWRKAVKESCTVLELGTIVKTFRSGLLLTGAGGISDEEWEKRMGFAMESGDVELLVSLWGRLYDDVFKWVQSKSKQTHETVIDTNLVETFAELRKQFPQLQVAGLSPARITTAATLAAADAIAEHHINANALLAVPMKLLQQHSREDLFALREALEREKRHLAAKLAQLEENETLNREKEDLVAGFLATAPPSSSLDMSAPPTLDAMLPMPRNFVGGEQGIQGDEMDEGESDAVDSTHDADGEATDMSDSD